jgi:hypothetical protein
MLIGISILFPIAPDGGIRPVRISMMNANTSSLDGIVIRKMAPSDASDAAELSLELGYPVPIDVMEARLRRFASMGGHVVYAACLEDRVVGWIDVGIVHHLQSPPYGEIGALIVSVNHRGRGSEGSLSPRQKNGLPVKESQLFWCGRGLHGKLHTASI